MHPRNSIYLYSWLALVASTLIAAPAMEQPAVATQDGIDLSAQSGPKKHRKRQGRPIQMGTSGGNVEDLGISGDSTFCCSGTLGSLLRKGNDYFILSNNHVLARTNEAEVGEAASQPGMLDTNCGTPERNFVATLSGFKKLSFGSKKNKVDAAIAQTIDGAVDLTGETLEIGQPGNEFVKAKLGMAVQKSGRTTGFTRGVVSGLNATFLVGYTDSCSPDAADLTARFVKTIVFESANNKDFSAGGDSGSVIYEDVAECPRAVGLLFAGGVDITVASPMKAVLKQVKKMKPKGPAEMVGCDPTPTAQFAASTDLDGVDDRELRIAARIQRRVEDAVLGLDGVVGMAIGSSEAKPGSPSFRVYVTDARAGVTRGIPTELEGMPVEIVETGPIRALNCRQPAR